MGLMARTAVLAVLMSSVSTVWANKAELGEWGPVIDWTPHIPSSIANLPDGRILSWNSRDPDEAVGAARERDFTLSAIYNPDTGAFEVANNSVHGMFCPGISLLEDGSVLVSGGVPDTKESSLFDLENFAWSEMPEMNAARYYPTALTLPDNNVFLSHARSAGNTSEVFNSETRQWSYTPNATQQTLVDELNQIEGARVPGNRASGVQWYAFLSVDPGGKVLHMGPTQTWHYFDPTGGAQNTGLGRLTGDRARIYGNLVNYDIGKVVLIGGHDPSKSEAVSADNVYLVDMNGAAPAVTQGAAMTYGRTYSNSVVMPNGEIIVIGGQTDGANYSTVGSRFTPEIYNPSTNSWRLAADIAVPRIYHSTAILMKDARVMSAGGGVCGNRCPSPTSNQQNAQIYTPPYLINDDGSLRDRPIITDAPASVSAGDSIVVSASNGIQNFNLMRLSGTTHHINADQRMIPLSIANQNGGTYDLALPANPNVLLPGYYWMFALDSNGTPSIGRTIQVLRKGEIDDRMLENIAITNADFEAQVLADGTFTRNDIQGWETSGAQNGVWNPRNNGLSGLTPNTSYIDMGGSIAQTLNANLEPNMGLSMSFKVGGGGTNADGSSTWRVSIYAGDTVLGSVDNRNFDPESNQLINAKLELTPEQLKVHAAQYGQALRIEFSDSGNAQDAYFDDVSLARWRVAAERVMVDIAIANADFEAQPLNNWGFTRNDIQDWDITGQQTGVWRPADDTIGNTPNTAYIDLGGTVSQTLSAVFEENTGLRMDFKIGGGGLTASGVSSWAVRLYAGGVVLGEVDNNDIDPDGRKRTPASLELTPEQLSRFSSQYGQSLRIEFSESGDPGFTYFDDVSLAFWRESVTQLPTQESIAIVNADFEAQQVANWGFTRNDIQGWDLTGAQNGIWRPADDTVGNTPHTAYIDMGGTISQTLSATLEADSSLSMDFKVGGGGLNQDGSSSWAVRLYAGNTVLGTVDNKDVDPVSHKRIAANLTLTKDQLAAFSANYGQALKIEFSDSGNAANAYFDDVSLTVTRYSSPVDSDSDGDGVADAQDAFPNDPTETLDSDADGVGDNADPAPNDPRRNGQVAALPETPRQSSTLLVEQHNGQDRIWNVNPDNNSVSVSSAAGVLIKEIAVGSKPWALALSPANGKLYVTNKLDSSISIVDTTTLALERSVNLARDAQPHGVVFNSSGSHYYVVLEALAQLEQRSSADDSVTNTLPLSGTPRHVSMTPDDSKLLVSNFVTPRAPGEDSSTPDMTAAFAQVFVVDPANLSLTSTIRLPFDSTPVGESTGPGLPNYLGAPTISYDSTRAYIPSKKDNIDSGTLRAKPGMSFDQTVRGHTSNIDLTTGTVQLGIDHDNASVATGAAFSGDSRYLLITLETSRELVVYDTLLGFELMRLDTGIAPQSVAFSSNSQFAYVHNFMSRSISRFDLSSAFATERAIETVLPEIQVVAQEQLDATILKGKQLFYDAADRRLSRDSYMSCASCHKEGKHDGRTWDFTQFGEGLRNTTSLLGKAGTGHGLLHWTGNFDEIQDFEGQIRGFAGGTGLMTDAEFNSGTRSQPLGDVKAGVSADLDALAAYVSSLSDVEVSPYSRTDVSVQGRILFQEKNCASCHSGAEATDSVSGARHDIGTIDQASGQRAGGALDGFDTPSLKGIWASAPYLHDGSAATIEEAIMAHNSISLTTSEAAAIAEFIRSMDSAVELSNVALGKAVTQSSTDWGGTVTRAVDGNTSGVWRERSVTHTRLEQSPWLQVDLGNSHYIDKIRLWNRSDCCTQRLANFYVLVSETPFASNDLETILTQDGVKVVQHQTVAGRQTELDISDVGRYVRVQIVGQGILSLAELEVMGMLF